MIRRLLDLTQKDFGQTLGLKQATYQLYETGKTDINLIVDKLRDQYKVNIDWLIHGKGEMFMEGGPNLNMKSVNVGGVSGGSVHIGHNHNGALDLNDCNHELDKARLENEGLRKEIESMKMLLAEKDRAMVEISAAKDQLITFLSRALPPANPDGPV